MKRFKPSQVDYAFKKLEKKAQKCGFTKPELREGMNVEKEHADVTGGGALITAKIAAAHLCERTDYYKRIKKYVEPRGRLNGPAGEFSSSSFYITEDDVQEVKVSGARKNEVKFLGAYIDLVQVAPEVDLRIVFRKKAYETHQRLSHLDYARAGKLVLQFYPVGSPRNLVITLTPAANARFQVWLDFIEEAGWLLTVV